MLFEMKTEIRPVGLTVVTNVISLVRLEAIGPSCDDMRSCVTWYILVHLFTHHR